MKCHLVIAADANREKPIVLHVSSGRADKALAAFVEADKDAVAGKNDFGFIGLVRNVDWTKRRSYRKPAAAPVIETEDEDEDEGAPDGDKPRRGRPPGSKNKAKEGEESKPSGAPTPPAPAVSAAVDALID